jgi:uncharacterized membrane protein
VIRSGLSKSYTKTKKNKKRGGKRLFYSKVLNIIALILNVGYNHAAERFPDQKITLGLLFAVFLACLGAILNDRLFDGTGGSENHKAGKYHQSQKK